MFSFVSDGERGRFQEAGWADRKYPAKLRSNSLFQESVDVPIKSQIENGIEATEYQPYGGLYSALASIILRLHETDDAKGNSSKREYPDLIEKDRNDAKHETSYSVTVSLNRDSLLH